MREQSSNFNNSQSNKYRGGETKVMKKLFSSLLVFALLLTMVTPAFAATPSDVVGTDYEDAVSKLMALDIVTGKTSDSYAPLDDITRKEFAAMIVRATGHESDAELLADTQPFPDVAAGQWFTGYVAAAKAHGFINGNADGTFAPNDNVSGAEALAILLRAAGYNDNLPGDWPLDYVLKANSLGMLEGVDFSTYGDANRGVVAQLTSSLLDQTLVTYDEEKNLFEDVTDPDKDTFIEGKLKAEFTSKVVTDSVLDEDGIELNGSKVAIADGAFVGDWAVGQYVNYLTNGDDEITYLASGDNEVVEGVLDGNIVSASDGIALEDVDDLVLFDGIDVDTPKDGVQADEATVSVFLNGKSALLTDLKDDSNLKVYLNDDKEARFVVANVNDVESLIVDDVTETKYYYFVEGHYAGAAASTQTFKVSLDVTAMDDVVEGQVIDLQFPASNSVLEANAVTVTDNKIEGQVTKKVGDFYTFDGLAYEVDSNVQSKISIGDSYIGTLDASDIVVAVEATDEVDATTFEAFYGGTVVKNVLDDEGNIVQVAKTTLYTLDGAEVVYTANIEDTTTNGISDEVDTANSTINSADTLYVFELNDDGELVLVAETGFTTPNLVSLSAVVEIDDDGVNGNLITDDQNDSYYVTDETVIISVYYDGTKFNVNDDGLVSALTLADLTDGVDFKYATTGINYDYILVTDSTGASDGLNDVGGFFVEYFEESVYDPEEDDVVSTDFVTLNVNGEDVAFEVEGPVSSTEGNFVVLRDVDNDDVYDNVLLVNNSLATGLNFDTDSGNLFATDGTVDGRNDYIVTGDTVVLVRTLDNDGDYVYSQGTFADISAAAAGEQLSTPYSYKGYVHDSGELIGGYIVADYVVIVDEN